MSFNFIFFLDCLAGKIFGKLFQKVQLKRYDTYFIYLPISFAVTIGKPATNRNVYYICLFFFLFFCVRVHLLSLWTTPGQRKFTDLAKERQKLIYWASKLVAFLSRPLGNKSALLEKSCCQFLFSKKKLSWRKRTQANWTEPNESKLKRTKPRRNDLELAL